MFFLMTPKGVGSCFDGSEQRVLDERLLRLPQRLHRLDERAGDLRERALRGDDRRLSGPGQGFPNDEDADTTINTISHEHNESITDPFGDGWIAADGNENGDLCAYNYGDPIGTGAGQPPTTSSSTATTTRSSRSTATSGSACFQNSTQEHGSAGNVSSLVQRRAGDAHQHDVRDLLASHGGQHEPAGRQRDAGREPHAHVVGGIVERRPDRLLVPVAALLVGRHGLRQHRRRDGLDVHAGGRRRRHERPLDGQRHERERSVAVRSVGRRRRRSRARGEHPARDLRPRRRRGSAFSTTDGSWNTSATFAYQWQRCAAGGSGCVPISGATSATYALVGADAGHTLKTIVTATNVAGTASSTSAASRGRRGSEVEERPRISGKPTVGHRLAAGRGKWTWTPTKFRYQWLRCSAKRRPVRRDQEGVPRDLPAREEGRRTPPAPSRHGSTPRHPVTASSRRRPPPRVASTASRPEKAAAMRAGRSTASRSPAASDTRERCSRSSGAAPNGSSTSNRSSASRARGRGAARPRCRPSARASASRRRRRGPRRDGRARARASP